MSEEIRMSEKSRHFHHYYHIGFNPESDTFGVICGLNEDAEPVIKDEANERIRSSFSKPKKVIQSPEYSSPFEEEPAPEQPSDTSVSVSPEEELSGFDRFYSQQKDNHTGFYFALGLIIFLVLLLGIVSAVYLILNKLGIISI